MPKPLRIELTPEQRQELEWITRHDPLPYKRERATAILKVADGQSGLAVALHGLLQVRDPDTVYEWLHRYQAEGSAGLKVKAGRGRKPAFSPSVPD